jgi:hypothetical protein
MPSGQAVNICSRVTYEVLEDGQSQTREDE